MRFSVKRFKDLFVSPGHIREKDFDKIVREAQRNQTSIESEIINGGYIHDEQLGKVVADAFDWHYVDITDVQIPEDIITIIPEVVARSQGVVAFERKNDVLKLAMNDPSDITFIKDIEKKTGLLIEAYYTTERGIQEALKFYRGDLRKRVDALLSEMDKKLESGHEEHLISLVDTFLEYAYMNRASDIHLEPLRNAVSVRFRVDGVLHEIVQYPNAVHDKIVLRLKIMAHLRTDEHAAAQDGRFSYIIDETSLDVRLSVLPILHGENVVLRLLAQQTRRFTLDELGLQKEGLLRVRRAVEKPHGMILATGPTGSGKTTTLYAMLQLLNEPNVNIMTIEDPVEYSIPHIQQTPVNEQKKLTFATGLRAIVRQDPDIIMVGEVRDEDTASIAINAALTGHLLLSTLHTNDAATSFPRLVDMGIEPFLLASSVHIVIAQRLVRNICTTCRSSYTITKEERKVISQDVALEDMVKRAWQKDNLSEVTLYHGSGCVTCAQTGFIGRTGIFEVLEVNDEIRLRITEQASSNAILDTAQKHGMETMLFDGLVKVAAGITTLDEVLRAIRI
jgi:type IV pilus assembly protein PilB